VGRTTRWRVAAVLLSAGAVSLGWPVAVQAGDAAGWYGGITLGHPAFGPDSMNSTRSPANGDGLSPPSRDRDAAYAARVGYGFLNGFSLEAGYIDAGSADPGGRAMAPSRGVVASAIRAPGLNVNVLGGVPVARDLALFGKLGLLVPDGGVGDAGGLSSLGGRVSRSLPGVGLGLNYSVTGSLGLRAQWEKYHRPGFDLDGRSSIDQLSVGVDLRFR
jgi:opacity protein-like surface antigen